MEDFFYLTSATPQQQVVYMATLLLDAAVDWWVGLLKESGGQWPRDFQMMSTLLKQQFSSGTRIDRARGELRFICQGEKETVHAFSYRYTALLEKLPSYDSDWAVSQFIWGLSPKTTELVMMNRPKTLPEAIQKANDIEMARQAANFGRPQGQNPAPQRYHRGRGRRVSGRQ